MKRKIYLASFLLLIIVIVLVSAFSKRQTMERPNILLIVSEDNGPQLSWYGDEVIQTPNMDAIAHTGFHFTNAYVTESVCSSSRSTILSGLYPHQTGHLGLTTFGFHYVMVS